MKTLNWEVFSGKKKIVQNTSEFIILLILEDFGYFNKQNSINYNCLNLYYYILMILKNIQYYFNRNFTYIVPIVLFKI